MLRQLRKSLVWYVFIAPTFIIYAAFVAYPTLQTFRLSVFQEVATKQHFVVDVVAVVDLVCGFP